MLAVVQTEFRYRGRNISGAEIESVRQLIAAHPGLSRRRLSAKLRPLLLRRLTKHVAKDRPERIEQRRWNLIVGKRNTASRSGSAWARARAGRDRLERIVELDSWKKR